MNTTRSALRRATDSELREMQHFREQREKDRWGNWAHPMVVEAGTCYVTAIEAIIADRDPGFGHLQSDVLPDQYKTPARMVFHPYEDPWQVAKDIAVAMAMVLDNPVMGLYTLRKRELPAESAPKHWAED